MEAFLEGRRVAVCDDGVDASHPPIVHSHGLARGLMKPSASIIKVIEQRRAR
jgi:hypothetical protein